ncbi:hypothetical protein KAU55_06205, partial [Candidatus Bathyarchaeota archaeon]|nr:hypothetical protein [Candidatus Bathyarchaeota archaeon]
MKTSMVLTLVAIVIMFFSFLTSTTATRPYDPWCDINDDGKIDIKDVAGVASRYGTYGDAITKASINYTSGWIDITDKAGQYFNITHNLNSTDIIVDIQGKTTLDGGVHQRHLG